MLNIKKNHRICPEISRYWLQLLTRKDTMKVIVEREKTPALSVGGREREIVRVRV